MKNTTFLRPCSDLCTAAHKPSKFNAFEKARTKNFRIKPLVLIKKYAPILFLAAFFATCTTPPDYPIEPVLEFTGVTKDTLRRGNTFNDTTFIEFTFTDGDGDIGDQDSVVLFITDSRDGFVNDLKVPVVSNLGASNGIKGKIRARMFTSCCLNPNPLVVPCVDTDPNFLYDRVIYTITLKDRAGHLSNEIQTTPIVIKCFE
ncbi:MAG TPA: hypothetical protein ENJ95_01710 [Bacteroidetes bacterium]|nr:hypothetical protein [Bacteroidota bacterium]